MTTPAVTNGICRYCSCQDNRACEAGCSWTDDTRTLCSQCLGAETIAEMVVRTLGTIAEAATPRIRLVSSAWADLVLEQKQLLVLACRQVVLHVSEELLRQLDEDVRDALLEMQNLETFIEAQCPELRDAGETAGAMVQRLMTPALTLGRRILIP